MNIDVGQSWSWHNWLACEMLRMRAYVMGGYPCVQTCLCIRLHTHWLVNTHTPNTAWDRGHDSVSHYILSWVCNMMMMNNKCVVYCFHICRRHNRETYSLYLLQRNIINASNYIWVASKEWFIHLLPSHYLTLFLWFSLLLLKHESQKHNGEFDYSPQNFPGHLQYFSLNSEWKNGCIIYWWSKALQ